MAKPGISSVYRLASVFGGMFLVVTLVTAIPSASLSLDLRLPSVDGEPGTSAGALPDVHLLLLDGYPGDGALAAIGDDVQALRSGLDDRGFRVAADSRANYTATWATLASMFNGAYLDEIDGLLPAPSDPESQYGRLLVALNQGSELASLRARGYRIVTVPSPFDGATLVAADDVRDTGQLTYFELSLLQNSPLMRLVGAVAPDWVLDQHRDRIRDSLAEMVDLANDPAPGSRFSFTHVMSPHAPIAFEADGGPAGLPPCFPSTCTLWEFATDAQWADVPGQLTALDQLVLAAVDDLVGADPEAIVVVMSDHGLHPPGLEEAVMLDNLLAIRDPSGTMDPDGLSPVDLLPALREAVFGDVVERHAYRGWINRAERPLELTEVSR